MYVSFIQSFFWGLPILSTSISGLEWVAVQHKASGRPSVATMSFGGSLSLPLNDAVKVVCAPPDETKKAATHGVRSLSRLEYTAPLPP